MEIWDFPKIYRGFGLPTRNAGKTSAMQRCNWSLRVGETKRGTGMVQSASMEAWTS